MQEPTNDMRVTVDGTTHPIHDRVSSLKAVLVYASGEIAEVQVAKTKGALNVVIAGDHEILRNDKNGYLTIRVWPTAKS